MTGRFVSALDNNQVFCFESVSFSVFARLQKPIVNVAMNSVENRPGRWTCNNNSFLIIKNLILRCGHKLRTS